MAQPLALWSRPEWLAEATWWLDEQLARIGSHRTGEVAQPHVRPWATAITAPTTNGRVWLKASAPATAFEARLYELLVSTVPHYIVEPIAIDVERAWLLLPDGGPPIRERFSGADLREAMLAAMPRYAELQRKLALRLRELL